MLRRAILLLPCLLAAAAAAPDEDAAVVRAREAESKAQTQLNQVRIEMIRDYRWVKEDHERLRGSGGAKVRSDLAALVAAEVQDTPAGRDYRTTLSNSIFYGIINRSLLTPPVARMFSEAVAERVVRFRAEAPAATAEALGDIFPDRSVDDIWDTVFNDLRTVRRWRAAYVELELARLERMRCEEGGDAAVDAPPDMVLVPGGRFNFGPHGDPGWPTERRTSENARTEGLQGFYIQRHEVTNEQYAAFLERRPEEEREALIPTTWSGDPPTYPRGRERHPVTSVTFSQARAYASHYGWELPTERQWEKAARGPVLKVPAESLWPWGKEFDPEALVWGGNRAGGTAQVLSRLKDRSPYYVTGMAGNVSEWTRTLADGRKEVDGIPKGSDRIVIRGGSFKTTKASETTTTYRWVITGLMDRKELADVGFRCVVDESDWRRRRK